MGSVIENMDDREVLRDFLLRSISDNNLIFSKYFSSAYKSNKAGYRRSYTNMLNYFMRDNELVKDMIFKDIEEHHPGYKVYQYFDIDTLYAYLSYQNKILEYIKPDKVHVLSEGKIVESGDMSLARQIENTGFNSYNKANRVSEN